MYIKYVKIKEIDFECEGWIQLAWDRVKWRALALIVFSLLVLLTESMN
jgi:hypothetical protein